MKCLAGGIFLTFYIKIQDPLNAQSEARGLGVRGLLGFPVLQSEGGYSAFVPMGNNRPCGWKQNLIQVLFP